MKIRQEQRLKHQMRQELSVTPQMIMINRILQLQRLDLRQEIELQLKENPALELKEDVLCSRCQEPLDDSGECRVCESEYRVTHQDSQEYKNRSFDDLVSNWDSGHFEDPTLNERLSSEDEFDPISNLSGTDNNLDTILRNYLLTYSDQSDDHSDIAKYMIQRIDEKGLLKISDDEISDELSHSVETVREIRANITRLDPIGLGAYSVSDALLAQVEALEDNLGRDLTLEKLIISKYRDLLARSNIDKIARGTNSDIKRVKEAVEFIKENLYAYPGEFFDSAKSYEEMDPDFYPEPDVIIREANGEFYPEIVDSGLPVFKISNFYLEAYEKIRTGKDAEYTEEEKRHFRQFFERARFFMDCVNQRRETIIRICHFLIKYQRDFLFSGIRNLKDLTRERVAKETGFHPSTISRALKGKYVQHPNRQIYSFDIFFDFHKVIILIIKEVLDRHETPENLLSDEVIAEKMKELGFDIARRTVAKYRERGKIPPKAMRKKKMLDNI